MPELPGPPDDLPDDQRRAWLEGAATVAQLQADQWAILAKQYRDAAEEIDDEADGGEDTDDDGGSDDCPECGGDLVDGFGGAVCTECDYDDS